MAEWIAALMSVFIIDPVQAEFRSRAESFAGSAAVVEQASLCIRQATPALLEKAVAEPLWAVRTSLSMTIGWTDPLTLAGETDPACRDAIQRLSADGEQDNA
ncbi:hypothetical protein [Rhizobium paknamense]|uniref:Uncharacterized protein n=1 Tax=Rhizobium paknamense TaxID=1206817 RepID=A0ABU0IBG1_9HYPH|nr:hypothetical protein [Rhizobium paknamense]MDQ0455564.1 hypothetical protein [Rhizobium paknamense]